MSWLNLSDISAMVGGTLKGPDAPVTGVVIDTRQLSAGALFVALRGARLDGHAFVDQAQGRAAGVLVSRPVPTALPQIQVADTLSALSQLARTWRARLAPRVLGLTGSNGKTTVKAMAAAILKECGAVLATSGNLNNHIGVPLTLLGLRAHHTFAVIEMGANHAGEIAALTRLVQPDVALITNAGPAHLEGFGSVAGVARAKAELFEGLTPSGIVVINADDAFGAFWRKVAGGRAQLTFGLSQGVDVQGRLRPDGRLELATPLGRTEVMLPLEGQHNRLNALAAAAAAIALGADLEAIRTGLHQVQPVAGRLVTQVMGDIRILDDTYNANPASLAAALERLMSYPGEPWLVLGDMAELGQEAWALHAAAGRRAHQAGVKRLYTLGPLSREATSAFGAGGFSFMAIEDLLAQLILELGPKVNVLVKGSRAMRMERVVNALQGLSSAKDTEHAA